MAEPQTWRLRECELTLDRPRIVAILNVTPDSFSDGGQMTTPELALRRAEEVLAEGADMLDVGGESTRPGASRIPVPEELARVLPALRAIRDQFSSVPISVDTTRAVVADAALSEGASAINDVSALRLDAGMGPVVARQGAGLVLMHSRGGVEEMAGYELAEYPTGVTTEVRNELAHAIARAMAAGIAPDAIVVDPGIGFAKGPRQSLSMLRHLDRLVALGFPVLVGASRKRFIGEITGVPSPADRVHGSVGAHVAALARGARLFRVHDVRAHRHALDVAWQVFAAEAVE